MARITMRKVQETKLSEVFSLYLASAAAKGVKDKTLKTYEQHFNAISKRLNVDSNISLTTSKDLDKMILRMREDGLSDSSINSYTRTLKVFFSWCNEQGYTKTNLKIYKASETVKETYTDDELMTLLKKPEADCKFCEYRNWVIINFLLNSGCRAATVRNIQNQDVDLSRKQIVLRHTKNGKVQVIPLCSTIFEIGILSSNCLSCLRSLYNHSSLVLCKSKHDCENEVACQCVFYKSHVQNMNYASLLFYILR